VKVSDQIKYDFVFTGTSMISILEAIYQNLCGKTVLMIDQQDDLGGAWLPLNIFGFRDVENAIHYFLPDPKGFQFMRDVLGWREVKSKDKFKIFEKPILGIKRVPYDNPFANVLESISQDAGSQAVVNQITSALFNILKRKKRSSVYVEGGAAEMLSKVKGLLLKTSVEVKLSTMIEDVLIDSVSEKVEMTVIQNGRRDVIQCSSIYVTHGAKIKTLRSPSEIIDLNETIHSRPAFHLLVKDEAPSKILEAIFTNNKLIKYAHDITRFARYQGDDVGAQKIFVFALHPHVSSYEGLGQDLLQMLKNANVVGKNATLAGQCWWDVFLPALDDSALEMLKKKFSNQVSILKTENFSRGIGLNAERWSEKLSLII